MLNSILPILRITIGNLPIYTSAKIYKGTFDIFYTNRSSAYFFNNHFISDTIYIVSSKMKSFSFDSKHNKYKCECNFE